MMNRLSNRALIFTVLVFLSVFSIIGCGLLYHQVSDIFDLETKPTLTRDELFKKADSYASMLGIDIERSFKQYAASNNSIERFIMHKIHGVNDLKKKQEDGTYYPELFSIRYGDSAWKTKGQNEVILTDRGLINGFVIQKELLQGSLENSEAALISMIEKFMPHFTKQYKQIGEKSTSSKQSVSITQIIDTKKTEDVEVSSAGIWEKLFFNSADSKYIVFGTKNGNDFYFKQFNPLPDLYIEQAEHEQFRSKLVGIISIICSFLLIICLILKLRKQIPERDSQFSSTLANALLYMLIYVVTWDYYFFSPTQAEGGYAVSLILFILFWVVGVLIARYLFRFVFGFAEALTRAVRPRQIPLIRSMTLYILTSYQGMQQLLAGYLFIPIMLCATMLLALVTIKTGWIIIPLDNHSFLSFSKVLFLSLQAALIEESLFRGILLGGMLWYINRFKKMRLFFTFCAVLLQAVLFAGIHNLGLNSPVYAHLVLLLPAGIIFGVIYLRFGLFTAALTHGLYDLLLLTLHQTNPYHVTIMTCVVFFSPLLLLIVRIGQAGRLHSLTLADFNQGYVPYVKKKG